ncbi:MAG: BON domain-containing protein [Tatlockia sp.]|nr:BON domain-containing protein [Tatlockia sp.]
MKKTYLSGLVALVLTLLVGCQSVTPGKNFFNLGQTDQSLKATVLETFMNNPELATAPIHVETQKGTVLLSGFVKTIRQSDTAAEIATRIPGVKSVQNGLIVRK